MFDEHDEKAREIVHKEVVKEKEFGVKFAQVIKGLRKGETFVHETEHVCHRLQPTCLEFDECQYTVHSSGGCGGCAILLISDLERLCDRWEQEGWIKVIKTKIKSQNEMLDM